MRGGDLDPTDGQILHRRTTLNQLQIRFSELNPSPHQIFTVCVIYAITSTLAIGEAY